MLRLLSKATRVASMRVATVFLITSVISGCAYDKMLEERMSKAEIRERITDQTLAGHTVMTYSNKTQVEYISPDGKAYLWYPGNSNVVPSTWTIRTGGPFNVRSICFEYPPTSYNPSTKKFGGKCEISIFVNYIGRIVDIAQGDIFDLSTRSEVPFRLSIAPTSMKRLIEKASGKE